LQLKLRIFATLSAREVIGQMIRIFTQSGVKKKSFVLSNRSSLFKPHKNNYIQNVGNYSVWQKLSCSSKEKL